MEGEKVRLVSGHFCPRENAVGSQRIFFRFAEQDGWPTQARFWLEWGSSIAECIPLRLAEQKMNMLRHHYVPVNLKPETTPYPLQG